MIAQVAFHVRLTILVTITLFTSKSLAEYPNNPCPNLFKYEKDGDKTYGLITIKDVSNGNTALECEFSNMGFDTHFAGNIHLTIPNEKIDAAIKSGNPFIYRVDFFNNFVPMLSKIKVNGIVLCSGPKYPNPAVSLIFTHKTLTVAPEGSAEPPPQSPTIPPRPSFNFKPNGPSIPADLRSTFARSSAEFSNRPQSTNNIHNVIRNIGQPSTSFSHAKDNPFFNHAYDMTRTTRKPFVFSQPQTITQPFLYPPRVDRDTLSMEQINSICGQENFNFMVYSLASNGKQIVRSRFPWIVAIFKKNSGTLSFQCGGSLISSRTVITAAHCFYKDNLLNDPIEEEDILISMGRHNLTDWTDSNIVHADPLRIIQHPDYRPELPKSDADLAIVLFKNRVPFTLAIRPICLWQGTIDPEFIVGRVGTVVGWGKDQDNAFTTSPRLVNARVVSENTCSRSSDILYHLTSSRTLCAGGRDGSGPCDGDSGSGLMILKSSKWMLRGTVAVAVGIGVNRCNLDEYVIYTDIAKFLNWIHANMLL